jgi:hypothetical protein
MPCDTPPCLPKKPCATPGRSARASAMKGFGIVAF